MRFVLVFTVYLEHVASFLVRKRRAAKTKPLLHRPFSSLIFFSNFFSKKRRFLALPRTSFSVFLFTKIGDSLPCLVVLFPFFCTWPCLVVLFPFLALPRTSFSLFLFILLSYLSFPFISIDFSFISFHFLSFSFHFLSNSFHFLSCPFTFLSFPFISFLSPSIVSMSFYCVFY